VSAISDSAGREATSPGNHFAMEVGCLLSRATHALLSEFTAALEGHGISPREHAVLMSARQGAFTQSQLAKMVGLDKTTMVVTVDELEATGLAERVPSPHDRRARMILVTEAGERKLAEAEEILTRVREDIFADISEDDREVFLRCLDQLASGRLGEPVSCTQPLRRSI
jgi:MarR family transcriptional regulator, transcriptional regulator for hemolysin